MALATPRSFAALRRRLTANVSGVALVEFALAAPIVLTLGMYGIESANLALVNLKVSQIALNLADNASRVGLMNDNSIEQLREVDMNDVLQAARYQGQGLDLTNNGRITVSSLEANADGSVQTIHWQRCLGVQKGAGYDTSYGIASKSNKWNGNDYDPDAGVDTDSGPADNSATHPGTVIPGGMGDTGAKVIAPANSGVIFVEVNYRYQPLISGWLLGASRIHYIASYVVRDRRDFSELYNPTPSATASTCNKYTA